GLPIRRVVSSSPSGESDTPPPQPAPVAAGARDFATGFGDDVVEEMRTPLPFTDYGISVNSGEFSGLPTEEAQHRMIADAKQRGIGEGTVQYRLKDWGISRQRYWGTPIPMIYCEQDGIVPVPDDQLPVELPKVAQFSGRGDSPLAQVPEFVNVTCPTCGGPARRETDT